MEMIKIVLNNESFEIVNDCRESKGKGSEIKKTNGKYK